MLLRASRLLIVLALTFAVGGHWVVLQSVAWVGMVANYSQESTITEAVAKALSGKVPCKLCKFVAEGKQSERQQEFQKPTVKLDLLSELSLIVFDAPPFEPVLSPGASLAITWLEAPPVPPPLAA